jgi:hypothetical protein
MIRRRRTLRLERPWNEFWQSCRQRLEEEAAARRPLSAREVVECLRYGFVGPRRHPVHMRPEVEQEIYEDYMSGQADLGDRGDESGG